jgi:ATP-dependent Lon protease
MAIDKTIDITQKPEADAIPKVLPLFLPKDLVIFPGLIVPLSLSDEDTIAMIDDVMQSGSRILGSFLQKPNDNKDQKSFHSVGTAITIHRLIRLGDGSLRMIVQGLERIQIEEMITEDPYPKAKIKVLQPKVRKTVRLEALVRALREDFEEMAELTPDMPDEFKFAVQNIEDVTSLVDLITSNMELEPAVRQQVLSMQRIRDRIILLRKLISRELQILRVGNLIQDNTREEIEKNQREYFLRQQLKQIKKELGDDEEESSEIEEWREKIEEADLPEEVLEVAEKEIKRLEKMNPASAEYSVVTTYLDWLVSLPWMVATEDNLDIEHAFDVLEEDHYGLKDVKDRILEVLAVRKLKPDAQGTILCLAGPPGVGKTSLGQSIARAMGRNFTRISLGGVRDEAEIRGHRRTYVGALPGRIIQNLKKVGSNNPVFMLDEVDKLGSDFRGDPSSGLLEVLDPAQNDTFNDHYLDLPFDLSRVFFIATANYLENIPPPLRDRMEIIQLPGYIAREKIEIAKNYLVPRQIDSNGLMKKHISFTKAGIEETIIYYTREAGVRNLERAIGKVCRKVAREVATTGNGNKVSISRKNVSDFLGPRKITPSWARRRNEVGITTGLAYTPFGGSVLQIETALMPGKGGLKITGQLGDVMKESAQIAISWVRANQKKLGIKREQFEKFDLHIHVPEGATPKDGPSAGVTMITSIASRYSGKKVRGDVAMTGEVTLSGDVLPIGGLREKTVAANRARIKHVLIPWENKKDLEKVPEEVCEKIDFHPVKTVQEVLDFVLV